MTNGDKVRLMSNRELASLVIGGEWSSICHLCKYCGTGRCRYDEEGEEVGSNENCEEGAVEFFEEEVGGGV